MLSKSALGASDVVLFYGWGPDGWSAGIDQIARKVRTLRGVDATWVGDYSHVQSAYDWAVARPPEHSLACVGYSCGGNQCVNFCGGMHRYNRSCAVIMLQPSQWCGRYPTTPNMIIQDTWSPWTWGLGSWQPEPVPARYTTFVERQNPHGAADTSVQYQRDAVFAVGAVADPSRRYLLERHLIRTAPHVDRQDASAIWRRE
jgi:hypothetical protein